MSKRRRFTPRFKAPVALEPRREERTAQEIAARHGEPRRKVGEGKHKVRKGLEERFERGTARRGKQLDHVPYWNPAILSVRLDYLRQAMVRKSPGGSHSTIRPRIPSTSAGVVA